MKNSHRKPNTFNVFPWTEYKNSFFRYVINESNNLNPNIPRSSNYNTFHYALLKFIKPVEREIFNSNDPFAIRLKLAFSHMRERKFRYCFKDT